MRWGRMLAIAIRLAWPHLLAPWRSPLVRWRIETYGFQDAGGALLHAEDITPRRVVQFVRSNRLALVRFLRWAASL